ICAAGENFCGACGADLAAVAAKEREQLEAEFVAVAQMQAECRYDDAITRLVPITKVDHPRLADCGRRAKQLVHQLTAERNEQRNTCGEAYKRAQQCF